METQKKSRTWWPMGIVAALGLFIGGIVLAVTLMFKAHIPMVSENYYEQELAYQGQIEKEENTLRGNKKPRLTFDATTKAFDLEIPSESTLSGNLTFFRPSNPGQDWKLPLNADAAGRMQMDLRHLQTGLWIVQVDWEESGKSYYYEEQLKL